MARIIHPPPSVATCNKPVPPYKHRTHSPKLRLPLVLNKVNELRRCHNLVNGRDPSGKFSRQKLFARIHVTCIFLFTHLLDKIPTWKLLTLITLNGKIKSRKKSLVTSNVLFFRGTFSAFDLLARVLPLPLVSLPIVLRRCPEFHSTERYHS